MSLVGKGHMLSPYPGCLRGSARIEGYEDSFRICMSQPDPSTSEALFALGLWETKVRWDWRNAIWSGYVETDHGRLAVEIKRGDSGNHVRFYAGGRPRVLERFDHARHEMCNAVRALLDDMDMREVREEVEATIDVLRATIDQGDGA